MPRNPTDHDLSFRRFDLTFYGSNHPKYRSFAFFYAHTTCTHTSHALVYASRVLAQLLGGELQILYLQPQGNHPQKVPSHRSNIAPQEGF